MKRIVSILLLLYCTASQAQLIIDETLTPEQLVQNVLVDPSVVPFNITLGGGAANVIRLNAARFATNFNPTNLGLDEGVILATGRARVALGPNNFGNDTEAVSPTATNDPDLQILSQSTNVKNSTVLEFDFVATGVELNFDFIFASEEYPEYAGNSYNDSFGFFLSGPGLSGPYSNNSTNIALIPGTITGVSINTINNGSSATGPCTNCSYYVDNDVIFPADPNSTIEYDGFTTVLKAVSPLICGETYHIKLAVGNVRDDGWDSAVFLKNFRIAPLVLVDNLNLEENLNVCFGEIVTLNSGLTVGSNLFVWRNGTTILPETGPILTTTVSGTYSLTVTTSFGCQIAFDEITVAFRPEIAALNPPDLTLCYASPNPTVFPTIDQTTAIMNGLDPLNYEITYYSSSYQNALAGVNQGVIPNSNLTNYAISGTSATIWVRIQEALNTLADCVTVKSFTLNTFDINTLPVVSSVSYCQNAPAIPLSATGPNLLWYATARGGVGSSTAPTPDTTTAGRFYFYVSQSQNGCESERAEIIVTIAAIPAPPSVTATVGYCEGETATRLSAVGSNLLWYPTLTGGTASVSAPLPDTTSVGSAAYYVTQTINGCESTRAEIVVNVGIAPAAPVVISQVVYCQNAVAIPLTANGTNLTWFTTDTGGVGSAMAPVPNTLSAGSTFYYVSQSNGCEGPRAAIEVLITPAPISPSVGPVFYCEGAAANQLSAGGMNLLWYNTSNGGVGSSVAPTPQTSILGSTNFYVSQTINGCESARAVIVVAVNALPDIPGVVSPIYYCQNAEAIPLTASGINLKWYTSSTGGNGVASITPSTASVGSVTYYVSQTTNGCEGPRSQLEVVIEPTPNAPIVISSINYCQFDTANALNATGTNLLYYTTLTGGIGSPIAPIPDTSISGNSIYYVSQTNNSCEGPRNAITVIVNPVAVPVLPQDGTICVDGQNNSLLNTFTITTGISQTSHRFEWFLINAGVPTSILGANLNTYTAAIPGLYGVIATHIVTGCDSELITAPVGVSSPPTAIEVLVSNYFEDSLSITVIASPAGNYEYQLDFGPFQISNIFHNVRSGSHTITVRDVNRCGQVDATAFLIDYPKFFTPNGDGYNDTWNIADLSFQSDSKIYIYDRYGKLVAFIKPSGEGWDGTYNGRNLPSTDYWFVVDYLENNVSKEFKAHFSMKR